MLNNFAQKILINAIGGPPSIDSLSVEDCFNLLTIYNKRYVSFLLEYGQSFDLYISEHHSFFNRIRSQFGYGEDEIYQIEANCIYANFCDFLFYEDLVSREEIEGVLSLCDLGFLNFIPNKNGLSLTDLFYEIKDGVITRKQLESRYQRRDLSAYPVLLTLPNKVLCGVEAADRHFVVKTPQYARYTEAIRNAQLDAKKLKSMNEVYSTLIIIDECIDYFRKFLKPQNSSDVDPKILDFLNLISSQTKQSTLECTQGEHLQWSKINQVLDWLLNTKSLKKSERMNYIQTISKCDESSISLLNLLSNY